MKFLALALVALPVILAQTPEETTGKLGDAPKVTNNPANATYKAIFTQKDGIKGTFTFTAGKDGEGVNVKADLTGFASKKGPFKYHLHDAPVPADGNCTGTLAHLDPYQRGQVIPCDADKPETCEVGDLSGKHTSGGSFTSDTYANEYTDAYLSLTPGDRAFFGNRSVTIHGVNGTRIACANVTLASSTTPKNGTVNTGSPKGDDEDDSDENSGKGGSNSGSDNDDKDEDPSDSAAGVARAGIVGLTAAVAAVVGLLL